MCCCCPSLCVVLMVYLIVWSLFLSFSLDLARLIDDSAALGHEVHLQGTWPMTAMIWTASNLEADGRLFDVPLPVTIHLSSARRLPLSSGISLPRVVTHPATPRPGGGYRPDMVSLGEFNACL